MKKLLTTTIALTLTVLLSSCSLKGILQGATTVASVPACRQELINYLPPVIIADLGSDLALLDSVYNDFSKAIAGDADISFQDAVIRALGAPEEANRLEAAHKNIESTVLSYKEGSGQETSPGLKTCNANLKRDWEAARDTVENNEYYLTAKTYLDIIGPYALKAVIVAL